MAVLRGSSSKPGIIEDEMVILSSSSTKKDKFEDENLEMGLLLGKYRVRDGLARPQHPTFVEFLGNPKFAAQSTPYPTRLYGTSPCSARRFGLAAQREGHSKAFKGTSSCAAKFGFEENQLKTLKTLVIQRPNKGTNKTVISRMNRQSFISTS